MLQKFFTSFLCLLLLGFEIPHASSKAAKSAKAAKGKGSSKCEKGVFDSLSKDGVIPLCDAHYPDENAKSSWLIFFYNKKGVDSDSALRENLNRVAIDLGNEPPEKSKSLKKAPKKQRTRIKDLGKKYDLETDVPKTGQRSCALEAKGKDPLLKVGAVCCDCKEEQQVCKNRDVGLRLVQQGQETAMPSGLEDISNVDKVIKWIIGELGFIKGQEPSVKTAAGTETPSSSPASLEDLTQQLEDLKEKKAKATTDEEYMVAKQLKKEIEELQAKIDSLPKEDVSLQDQLAELERKKTQAKEDEDYELAGKLKEEIAKLQTKISATPSQGEDISVLRQQVEELKVAKDKAIESEDYILAKKLKKDIEELNARIKDAPPEEDKESLEKKLKELQDRKETAKADEDFELAGTLKEEITQLQSKIAARAEL